MTKLPSIPPNAKGIQEQRNKDVHMENATLFPEQGTDRLPVVDSAYRFSEDCANLQNF